MKIAIATTFYEMDQQYSLVTVVRDRYAILAMHGHEVEVWVQENFSGFDFGMNIKKIMPIFRFNDYQSSELLKEDYENVEKVKSVVCEQLSTGIEAVFCEDLTRKTKSSFTGRVNPKRAFNTKMNTDEVYQ